MKLLIIDTETGGLYPSINPILSLGAIVWEKDKVLNNIEILINDDLSIVDKESLAINKIDLNKHKKKALSITKVTEKFLQFINNNFSEIPVILGGHNIDFDVNFLKRLFYLADCKYETYFSHRVLDTMSILYYLYMKGKIPYLKSLQPALAYFKIAAEPAHTALKDAIDTAKLLDCLLKL